MRIAIVGGGLGGLITAYYIEKLLTQAPKLTIFESSSRLGGKIRTGSFESVSALYEAGVAELYNYSMGFYPDSTDGYKKVDNSKSFFATRRRIRGL